MSFRLLPLLIAGSFLAAAASPVRAQAPAQGSASGSAQGSAQAPAPAERPALLPTRDAVVGYRLSPGAGETIDVRVFIAAGGGALRLDLPDQSYMVAAPKQKKLTLVVPLEQTALEMPWTDGPQGLFLLDDRARFARKGENTVAGQRCTTWDVTLDRGRSTVCVTPEGVLLRNQSQDAAGRRNLIEAFAVRYQALVESDFAVPDGFERLVAAPKGGAR